MIGTPRDSRRLFGTHAPRVPPPPGADVPFFRHGGGGGRGPPPMMMTGGGTTTTTTAATVTAAAAAAAAVGTATGPRRNLTFDTGGPRTSILPVNSSHTEGGDSSNLRDATMPTADRMLEQARMEETARKELEEELLQGIKEDLRRLAGKLDADDWMYTTRVPVPFKM